jgi:hypothetical protein
MVSGQMLRLGKNQCPDAEVDMMPFRHSPDCHRQPGPRRPAARKNCQRKYSFQAQIVPHQWRIIGTNQDVACHLIASKEAVRERHARPRIASQTGARAGNDGIKKIGICDGGSTRPAVLANGGIARTLINGQV